MMDTEDHYPKIQITRLRPESDADVPLPRYMTPSAAGMDICAAVFDTLVLTPGAIHLIPTGFSVAIPEGFEAPQMMRLAKLQAWTIKPAVLRK